MDFTFRNKEYHVEFAGADIYPQGFAAAFYRLQDFKGINMLADIGNGTMNIMYINNSRPLEKKCSTEKYGTHQCVLAVRESLLKELGTVVDDLVIEQVIRTGTADIGEKYLTVIRKAAGDYTKEIFHKLREREYINIFQETARATDLHLSIFKPTLGKRQIEIGRASCRERV